MCLVAAKKHEGKVGAYEILLEVQKICESVCVFACAFSSAALCVCVCVYAVKQHVTVPALLPEVFWHHWKALLDYLIEDC